MRRLTVIALALLAVLVLPDVAHACPVCFDSSDENRQAFLVTTAFMTLLPLGMVGGAGLWLRKRVRDANRDEGPESGATAHEAPETPSES